MKYQKVLETNGLTEKTVSRPILLKIREYKQLSQEADTLQTKMKAEGATDEFKTKAKATLDQAKIEMAELDAEISAAITKWMANRDRNAAMGAALREKKAAKRAAANGGQPAAVAASTEPAPAVEPSASVEPPAPVVAEPVAAAASAEPVPAPAAAEPAPAAAEPARKTESKDSGVGLGWIIGGALLVVGAVFGIRAWNNK